MDLDLQGHEGKREKEGMGKEKGQRKGRDKLFT